MAEEYYDDYFEDDTAICTSCGHYYCKCCGCDCWFFDEEYQEDSE